MQMIFSIIAVLLLLLNFAWLEAKAPVDSTVVFVKSEGGYYCHKIPYLLRTSNGTLIALAEGRGREGREACDDFSVIVDLNAIHIVMINNQRHYFYIN